MGKTLVTSQTHGYGSYVTLQSDNSLCCISIKGITFGLTCKTELWIPWLGCGTSSAMCLTWKGTKVIFPELGFLLMLLLDTRPNCQEDMCSILAFQLCFSSLFGSGCLGLVCFSRPPRPIILWSGYPPLRANPVLGPTESLAELNWLNIRHGPRWHSAVELPVGG